MTGRWPVDVEALSACNVGTVVWRHAGRTTLTVVIKATFSLDEGNAAPTRPDDILLEERLSPAGSPTQDADIAPYKPRAEVTFVGHATSATPVQHLSTRLSVHAGNSFIDKPLSVVGDRPTPAAPPVPFTRMALSWDRALAEASENPVGANQQAGRFPNVYDPQDPRAPASYAPMSRTWGARRRFIGRSDPSRASGLTPEMPPDLSWGFFLGAPQDQQLNRLSGSEIVVLENLLEGRPRVRSQLPGARGVARVYGPGTPAGGGNIDLRLDTLAIDGDRGVVSLVWRGTMPVTDDATTRGYQILAGVESNGEAPITFPAQPGPRAAEPKDSHTMPVGSALLDLAKLESAKAAYEMDDEPSSTAGGSTMAIDPEVAMKMLAGRAIPFPGAAPPPPAPPPPAPPPPAPPPPAPPPPAPPPPAPPPMAGGFPAPQNVVVRPSATFVADDDDSVGSTMAITPEAAAALIARQGAAQGMHAPVAPPPPAPPPPAPPAPPPPAPLPPGFGPPPPVPQAPAPPALAQGMGRSHVPPQIGGPPPPPPPPPMPPPPDDDDGGGGTMVIHTPEPPRRR